MKTLRTVQKFAKIGKVLSIIVFVCSMIGLFGCVLGLVVTPITSKMVRQDVFYGVGGTELVVAGILSGAFYFAGELVLSNMARRYFSHELEAGTPFTVEGAKELMRLGIWTIWVPLAAEILGEIVYAVVDQLDKADFLAGSSVGLGVTMLAIALICRCGAEQLERRPEPVENIEE